MSGPFGCCCASGQPSDQMHALHDNLAMVHELVEMRGESMCHKGGGRGRRGA